MAAPTNFTPGEESGLDHYEVFITNSGGGATDQTPITIVDTLPEGLAVKSVELKATRNQFADLGPTACKTQTVAEV